MGRSGSEQSVPGPVPPDTPALRARRPRATRLRPRSALALLLAVASAATLGCPRMESRRPNVLVVLVDTLRADHLSFYGYPVETAPFLAAQAARAVVFENAWSTSSWTAPATASLFTGVYPVEHGVHLGVNAVEMLQRGGAKVTLDRVPDALETLPELMRNLGYRTFGVSDNPNVSEAQGFAAGFDRFENFDYAGAPRVNESLAAMLPEIEAAGRWFVYLHYMDPHQPYHPRRRHLRQPQGDDAHAAARAVYDSEIGWVDDHIRRAFELLGVDDTTVVIFAADHGEEFGDHGGTSHRFKLYEELMRIPLFIHVPGLAPRRVAVPASLVDLRPTLRAILGLPPSEQDSGIDLTPVMASAGNAPAERALFASRTTGVGWKRAIVRGRHKLIATRPGADELYDLVDDPRERRDLAAEQPERAAALLAELDAHRDTPRRWDEEPAVVEITDEDLKRLEELGYVGELESEPPQ